MWIPLRVQCLGSCSPLWPLGFLLPSRGHTDHRSACKSLLPPSQVRSSFPLATATHHAKLYYTGTKGSTQGHKKKLSIIWTVNCFAICPPTTHLIQAVNPRRGKIITGALRLCNSPLENWESETNWSKQRLIRGRYISRALLMVGVTKWRKLLGFSASYPLTSRNEEGRESEEWRHVWFSEISLGRWSVGLFEWVCALMGRRRSDPWWSRTHNLERPRALKRCMKAVSGWSD